jgi:deoxyribonucleoside regulator
LGDRLNKKFNSEKIVQAAELFYEQRINQIEIARILGCSRSTVSRLLSDAIEQGIVKISIKRPVDKNPVLAEPIRKHFGLKEVIVVSAGITKEQAYENVGYATAELLSRILHPGIILGISWGVTLSYVVKKLDEFSFNAHGVEVVQLMGGLGSRDPAIDGPELARKMAECLGGTYRTIQAPALLDTTDAAQHILKEPRIKEVMDLADQAEIVLTSVGSLKENLSSIERSGFIKKEEMEKYLNKGAIGHSLARLIDKDGNQIDHPYNQRVIAVPFDVLKKAKWSIGIAANPLKAQVILAALRNKLFNVLIVDEGTAKEVLKLIVAI